MKPRKSQTVRTESAKVPDISEPPQEMSLAEESPAPAADLLTPPKPLESADTKPPAPSALELAADGITVCLSSSARQKLDRHMDGTRWTRETLIDRLILEHLHFAYPAISYRTVVLASAGIYRLFDRRIQAPDMIMESGSGKFVIRARAENLDFERWLRAYQQQGDSDAERKAKEMAVFILQQRLERFDGPGACAIIYPDDFLVERLA